MLPSFKEAFWFWFKLGFVNFGGPAGQIALMHEELVNKKKWIDEDRFLHALNYCMLLPGPEAQQLAIYIGWMLHRTLGGVIAGLFFVLPSFFVLVALSFLYLNYGHVSWVEGSFWGLKPVVMALVFHAVIRIGQKSLKNFFSIGLAIVSFGGLFFFKLPFPLIIVSAGLLGWMVSHFKPQLLKSSSHHQSNSSPTQHHWTHISWQRSVKILLIFGLLWGAPFLWFKTGLHNSAIFWESMGLFFTKAALVTFGGAYAVLPYIAQAGVEQFGWLTAAQMMDGLGLAETTPGPLIMVVTFVGYIAGWNGTLMESRFLSALMGAGVATYFTFLPSFLLIFLGAPFVERLRTQLVLSRILTSITAAVVGVILNLALFFGSHVLYSQEKGLDTPVVIMSLLAFVALWRLQLNPMLVIALGAMGGLVWKVIGSFLF